MNKADKQRLNIIFYIATYEILYISETLTIICSQEEMLAMSNLVYTELI